ncbi:hypothetical protein PMZ80_010478 [Knufia obscura]|uniref:Uncharacterized protein n=1 Tax=Knufia obscura TaxID=1635080 RepID=A0ABR0RAE6_9EURO|nr:hypothetical protein PMZ80_010478 [Knufia obscura]
METRRIAEAERWWRDSFEPVCKVMNRVSKEAGRQLIDNLPKVPNLDPYYKMRCYLLLAFQEKSYQDAIERYDEAIGACLELYNIMDKDDNEEIRTWENGIEDTMEHMIFEDNAVDGEATDDDTEKVEDDES